MYENFYPKLVRAGGQIYFVVTKRTHAGPETEYDTVFKMPVREFMLKLEKDASDVAGAKGDYWPKFGNIK